MLENGVGYEYVPNVRVVDSEQMDIDIRKDLLEIFHSKLSLSYQTSMELMGLNIDEEVKRRK